MIKVDQIDVMMGGSHCKGQHDGPQMPVLISDLQSRANSETFLLADYIGNIEYR